ncbi:Zinc finger protein 40 [Mactra antiquata]
MPRQRHSASSPEKRCLEIESNDDDSTKRIKILDNDGEVQTDSNLVTIIPQIVGEKTVVDSTEDIYTENKAEEFPNKKDNSGGEEESELRERSLSNSSSTEQRNRSLEALFQVTDTELQAISKQTPDGHQVIHINDDGHTETVYVIDSVIQEREELVEEAEIYTDGVESIETTAEESNDDNDETNEPAGKDPVESTSAPGTSEEEHVIDTPKWRQFKNIERILQKAGIDTSSKTWQTLTRPGRHICPYCQRACTKPSVLEKHIRAHTGERPYPCLVCGFAFKTKSNLYKHCKSRAHTLKTNVEARKLRAQGLSSTDSVDVQPTPDVDHHDDDKKLQMEPAQRHVIQEVVKYLEKDKDQRPNEVQTERQRAKLERLKSMQEKGVNEIRKPEETKGIHRQLSLPVLPTNMYGKGLSQHLQKIAPKGMESPETPSGLKNISQILLPGTVFLNKNGEMVQTVQRLDSVEQAKNQASTQSDHIKASDDIDSSYYNQIEIVNLPNPDTDPETSTKALRDLEELSEKFSAAAQDGLRLSTSVHSLPDKRVQVVLQLQRPVKKPMETLSSSETTSQARIAPPRSALKERIQRLISANEAIIDTPKVEPPRAKCIKRNLSRQDSETCAVPRSETEAAVSGLVMPSITSVPLQPLQHDLENSANQSAINIDKISEKNIIVEKIDCLNEDVLVINNEALEENDEYENVRSVGSDSDKVEVSKVNLPEHKETEVFNSPALTLLTSSKGEQVVGKGVRMGLQLSIASSSNMSALKNQLHYTSPSPQSHKPTSSVIMSPVATSTPKSTVPGHLGKMALKNLQMRSKSLSSLNVASATTPSSPVVVVSQPAVSNQVTTPYMIHTPTTPVAQVMMPGSNVPVLLLSGTSGASLQPFTPTIEQRPTVFVQQVLQPGILPSGSQVVNVVQTPTKSSANQLYTSIVPSQTFVVNQSATESAHYTTVTSSIQPNPKTVSFAPSLVTNPSSRSLSLSSPLVIAGQQPDPMKILSSIVSNTVKNNPNVAQPSTSQPKEIKIEIKLPPLQSSSTVPQRTRPPLKRQNPVSSINSPSLIPGPQSAGLQMPVFRFQSLAPNLVVQNKFTQPTPTVQNRFQLSVSQTSNIEALTTTTAVAKTPQSSVIKEFLLRENVMVNKSGRNSETSESSKPLFQCHDCHITFKKQETLDLHYLCYCKRKNVVQNAPEPSINADIQTKIVSQLFSQSANVVHEVTAPEVTFAESLIKGSTVSFNKLRAESFDTPQPKKTKFEFPIGRSKSVIISPTERKLTQRIETPVATHPIPLVKGPDPKISTLVKEKVSRNNQEKVKKQVTTKKLKEMWQSKLKGQILKRKLKGKLLMNRSLSMDPSMIEDPKQFLSIANKSVSKTKHSDIEEEEESFAKKRPRLVRSQDDTNEDGITIRRPIFRRSKSVPEILKHEEQEAVSKNSDEDKMAHQKADDIEEKAEIDDWRLKNVSVPVLTADHVINQQFSSIKPIYQQNFRMKSFNGMGTPIQLMPSATLTPRPELMEMDKFHKTFSFEAGSLKRIQNSETNSDTDSSPMKSHGMKLPLKPGINLDAVSKVSSATAVSPCKLPKQGSNPFPLTSTQKSTLVRQFSLAAHTYPSMRSMTHLTFCCAYQLQPSYVKSSKKISMYSNWRIAQQNTNLLHLPTKALLSLYDSKYTTNPVWVMEAGVNPRSGTITHSSYWKIKNGEKDVDTVFSLMDIKPSMKSEKEKTKFEAGYKTTEESVYVRGRGRGKYVCETCGIRCKKPSMLKKHIRTHTDLRPYKCKHCRFSFKTKGNLQKHMKSKSHYKKCLDLGISPVPTIVDESQIDEEALQAQCYLSKRAQITDRVGDSSKSIDKDISTTDDNDDDDDDDDDDYRIVDDGDDDGVDDNDETVDKTMDTSSLEICTIPEDNENPDQSEMLSNQSDIITTESQHNMFLQSLGIIAKHQLTGDKNAPVSQTGSSSLQLPMVTSLGISLASINQLGTSTSVSSAVTVSSDNAKTSSLSTVYGNLSVENEGHLSMTKDSDVIWGLLNLSDQSNNVNTTLQNHVITTTHHASVTVKDSKPSDVTAESRSTEVTSSVKVNPSTSFLPPYLSMAASMKLKTTKMGPIIGQIIQNVTTKSSTSDTPSDRSITMPFQFQHPFPGSLGVMLSSSSTDVKYASSAISVKTSTESPPVIMTSDHKPSVQTGDDLMYVQIGNTKGEVDTVPAQIVNIDPAMFRGKSLDNVPEKSVNLPTENILQLRKVSDGLYVITTETDIGKSGSSVAMDTQSRILEPSGLPVIIPASPLKVPENQLSVNVGQVTGSASHVTGSSSNIVQQSENGGKFVCSICKASFPEHHQLILHGNIHFINNSRLKCEKCNVKFRSHSAYEKHLSSDTCVSTIGKTMTIDSADPRPYKCSPCNTAFRLKGHLTKHFRSRAHFKNLEALGNLAIGTWEKLEHKVSEVDACTLDEFLMVVERLLSSVSSQTENTSKNTWEQSEESVPEDEVFMENDGASRVVVEVNEQLYEMNTLEEEDKYRAYPLPGVFVEETLHSEGQETQSVTMETQKVKPHKCGLCGRGYETVAKLKTHLITHAELRPYVCEYCDAGFTNAQSLIIHLNTHTQEKPYVCGMCGLKFPNTTELSQHCQISHPPPGPSHHMPGTSQTQSLHGTSQTLPGTSQTQSLHGTSQTLLGPSHSMHGTSHVLHGTSQTLSGTSHLLSETRTAHSNNGTSNVSLPVRITHSLSNLPSASSIPSFTSVTSLKTGSLSPHYEDTSLVVMGTNQNEVNMVTNVTIAADVTMTTVTESSELSAETLDTEDMNKVYVIEMDVPEAEDITEVSDVVTDEHLTHAKADFIESAADDDNGSVLVLQESVNLSDEHLVTMATTEQTETSTYYTVAMDTSSGIIVPSCYTYVTNTQNEAIVTEGCETSDFIS